MLLPLRWWLSAVFRLASRGRRDRLSMPSPIPRQEDRHRRITGRCEACYDFVMVRSHCWSPWRIPFGGGVRACTCRRRRSDHAAACQEAARGGRFRGRHGRDRGVGARARDGERLRRDRARSRAARRERHSAGAGDAPKEPRHAGARIDRKHRQGGHRDGARRGRGRLRHQADRLRRVQGAHAGARAAWRRAPHGAALARATWSSTGSRASCSSPACRCISPRESSRSSSTFSCTPARWSRAPNCWRR